MKSKSFKAIMSTLLSVLIIFLMFAGCSYDSEEMRIITEQTTVTEEKSKKITVSTGTQELADDTKKAVEENQDISTNEVIESSENEEATVIDEGALENDGTVEQENFAWNGDANAGEGVNLLGSYQGLTYYNQADSRWANLPYTSVGDSSQTMKSSACGPTAAAMVVSSSKGAILPTTMANMFVDNGYRTANNGTAWACWPFVADYFGFEEYYATTSDSKMLSYLKTDNNNDGVSDYFVVVSVGSGLWTTGGHYIVLVDYSNGDMGTYDPYMYSGKYNTASRRAAGAVVDGNCVWVSESNFFKYSNTKQYWIFSNDNGAGNPEGSSSSGSSDTSTVKYSTTVGKTYKLKSATTLYSKGTLSGTQYQYKANTTVKVIKHYSATVDYIYVPATGRYAYCPVGKFSSTSTSTSSSTSTNYSSVVGSTYKLKSNTTLYSKGNLTGTKYQYLKNTTIKVLNHYSSTVDYIYVVQTGRYAYCPVSAFTNATTSSSTSYSTTVGSTYKLNSYTILYSKSNLTGTQYQYLANTTVKVLSHTSSSVDYIQVVQTGRKAYVSISKLK